MTTSLDPITRLVQECNPNEWLEPQDPRWVNCDDAREGDVIARLERSLRRARQPDCRLFAGHRGIGKTTELKRLQAKLQDRADGKVPFLVVYLDAAALLDPNDLEYPDLLALLAGEVQRALAAAAIPGFTAASTYMKRLWEDFRNLLGAEVRLSGSEVELPFGKLAVELRNRPSGRAQLREKIESLATDLTGAINQLLDEANAALRASGRAGLVLIVDGLDKISRRPLPDGGNTHDRLFIDRSEQLASLKAHTIYTIPISMYYSPRCAVLEQTLGEFNTPLSMICLRAGPNGEVTPGTMGMQKLWEMLDLRCKKAGVTMAEAFDADETWQYLCRMSGGHPRHLLALLCDATSWRDQLPVTRQAVDQAVRSYGNSLLREIDDSCWEKLRRFDQPQRDMPKDDDHQQMLFLLHVFEYVTGTPWYEVNPVLRTLERFRS